MTNTTFFSLQLSVPGVVRPFQAEGEIPETETEVLAAIGELPKDWRVRTIWQIDYDAAPQDVTADLALVAYRAWRDAGGDPDNEIVPQFIQDHAPDSLFTGYSGERETA